MWAKVNPFSPLGSGMRIAPFWTRPVNGTCLWVLCWSKIFSHPCYLLSSISVQWMEWPNYVEARIPLISDTCFHASLVQWMEWTKLCWSKVFSQPRYVLSGISCPVDGMDQIMLKQGLPSPLIAAFTHLLSSEWSGQNWCGGFLSFLLHAFKHHVHSKWIHHASTIEWSGTLVSELGFFSPLIPAFKFCVHSRWANCTSDWGGTLVMELFFFFLFFLTSNTNI